MKLKIGVLIKKLTRHDGFKSFNLCSMVGFVCMTPKGKLGGSAAAEGAGMV